jgi:molecular chaperone GrpE
MSKENLNDINEEVVNNTNEEKETVEAGAEEKAATTEETAPEEKKPTVEEELEMYKDKHLRMYSEFENFRRRSAKERVELIQNAGQEIIKALLPILDDFDRAIAANQDATEVEPINEGMELIHSKIYNLLNQKGLKPMDAQGKDFNSDDYEAIAKIPAPAEDLKGKVVDVVEKGYYLNSKILRHAKVVIGE